MLVLVLLSQMQPHADHHHQACSNQLEGQRLMQEHDGNNLAKKRCRREIGCGARSAKMAQSPDEERKADAVAEEDYKAGGSKRGPSGQVATGGETEQQIHGSGDQPFQLDDLQWVSEGDLARQIII